MEESINDSGSSSSPPSSSIVPRNESSAEIVGSIDDLLLQILLKLPIKSLIRFKLVSKPWLSMITNPTFFPKANPRRGILLHHTSRFQFIPLSPNAYGSVRVNRRFHAKDEILHACNGLMVCSRGWDVYYVCNPTTNCSTTLPLDGRFYRRVVRGTSIAFNPVKSQHYKVVQVLDNYRRTGPSIKVLDLNQRRGPKEKKFIFRIYSSETDQWTTGGELAWPTQFRYENNQFRFEKGVYCNGCIHWLGNDIEDVQRTSLRFNVDSLILSEMPSPPEIVAKPREGFNQTHCYFGESCDHLHYAECTPPQFNIYEMAADYSQWFVKYNVNLSNLIVQYPEAESIRKYVNYILSIVRGKSDDSDSFLVLRTPRKAIKFNLVDGTVEELCDFNEGVGGYAVDYVPSLASTAAAICFEVKKQFV